MSDEKKPVIPVSAEQEELRGKLLAQMRSGSIKAVSFKLHDVLVLTPFSGFTDIFMQLESELSDLYAGRRTFTEMRVIAQDYVEVKYGKKRPITLGLVYDRLQKAGKLSLTAREKLQQRECELVEYYSSPRQTGLEMFREAKAHGKKIIIIADTIYPRSTVENVLKSCGYADYDELIMPSELNIADTDSRSAIDAAILKADVPAGKLLHIGPNVAEDVEYPILKGQKALMLAPVLPLMVRSGRLRGFVEAKHLLDTDDPQYLPLHSLFGLYSMYCFDIPQGKTVHSDFCGSAFMLGFIVLGGLSMCEDFAHENELQSALIAALEECPDCRAGRGAFRDALALHFGDHLGKYGSRDCQLPLIFLEKHSSPADRELLKPYLSAEVYESWAKATSEPEIAPVYYKKARKGGLYRVADKLFPPGSKVRSLADGALTKLHRSR